MVPIKGRPIAEIQLDWIARNGNLEQVAFACGPRWERLKEHFGDRYNGIRLDYVVEDQPLGTGGAVKHIVNRLGLEDSDLLVLNGDVLTDLPLRRMLDWHLAPHMGTMVTMLLVPYRSLFGVVRIDKLRMVRRFEEKPEFPDTWINGGIYLMNAKKILPFLPDQGDVERETFPKLVQYGEVSAFPYYGSWRVVDSLKDLQEAEAAMEVPLPQDHVEPKNPS